MDLPGPSSGEASLKIIHGKKGKPVILRAGYRYNFVQKNKNGTTNWRCFKRNECSTSITLNDSNDIIKEGKHTCVADEKRNLIDGLMEDCKKKVCENLEPIPKIYENFMESVNCLEEHDKPRFEEKKDLLYKARKDYLNLDKTTIKNLKELKLPHSLVEDFFLFDEGLDDKILIFGTPLAKEYLKKSKCYYGDGTFKVACRLFYQLYTLHINLSQDDEMVNFVPLLYILLPNKTQNTYERLFLILRNQFKVVIEKYRCDYEIAVIQAVRIIYPEVKITGCYFHYWKALFKNSTKIGFDKIEGGNYVTKLYMQLALLPPILIPEGVLSIQHFANESEEFTKFNDYFTKQWLTLITQEIFSCYNQSFRTNNSVEGWHGRLRKRFPLRPQIFHFIQLLKKEAKFQEKKIIRSETYCKSKRRST
ncbi:uncharacterized protein LOC114364133 [Ostrinia furnacalis]|uniref:uncharacterized protein LOC114364133 n=1 Tax=Ostrinia furnacalis TaxID=93504 RepID=UPI00103B0D8F|nr:uncharacterized protein LOC114364133 [Ostrinia furnacalis]